MSELKPLQSRIAELFQRAYGRTPLPERMQDIIAQSQSLGRLTDLDQIKDETGDLLCAVLQLCNECGWEPEQLAEATLAKIKSRMVALGETATPPAPQGDEIRPVPNATVAIFASTFDPPSRYHRQAAEAILKHGFDDVIVRPTGPRQARGERAHAPAIHRAALVDLTFGNLPGATVDLTDLDQGRFAPTQELESQYGQSAEVWNVVAAELIAGGREGRSVIQTSWAQGTCQWQESRFVVLHDSQHPPNPADMPPHCRLVALDNHVPAAELRNRVYHGQPIDEWVSPEVARYIRRHQLFQPTLPAGPARLLIHEPRLLIEHDERNPQAAELAERYRPWASDSPNLILVIGGDGTMLHSIRRHWRRRLPIVGLNAGHVGFLANERLPLDLEGTELVTYSTPLLRVDAETADGGMVRALAFSDTWLERDSGQAAWLRLDVDGQTRVPKIIGDGMLVSTAAGSSAYARAMGAIPVPLTTPVLMLAGSNIFRPRFWKPMTLADDAVITLTSLDRSGKRPIRGFVDGQPLGMVYGLTARHSPIASVELAFTSEFDPSGKLLRSLFPPIEEGG